MTTSATLSRDSTLIIDVYTNRPPGTATVTFRIRGLELEMDHALGLDAIATFVDLQRHKLDELWMPQTRTAHMARTIRVPTRTLSVPSFSLT